MSNTINWGKIQGLSYSPETNLTGTAAAPSFTNTKSILLDGVDDYVDITSTGSSLGSAWSVSAWVKTNDKSLDGSVYRGWFATGGFNTATKFKFSVRSDNGYAAVWEGNGQVIVGNANIVDNNWHNIIITKTASDITLFVDGTQQATVSNSETWSFNDIYLGVGGRSTGITTAGMWNGLIDEVAVFNATLSASDVTSIYNSGVPNDISSLSPISWWRCGDGDTSPTLTDNGSGGINGTMTNFTTFSTDVPT